MKLDIVPRDSLLWHWCKILSHTEVPLSYQLCGGISLVGCLLRRQTWIDQGVWKVYPFQPVLFVGDSGIGKDTIINRITSDLERVGTVPVLGGKTMEAVSARLRNLGKQAAAYIPAGELSSFFGQRDYQSGMIQEFTDLLSGGDKKDITTKGDLANNGKPSYIYEPTITLHGGSTVEWLHKAMPDGTMEGGFLGRFLILVEELGSKHIALVKDSMSREDRANLAEAKQMWAGGLEEILARFKKPHEMLLLEEAKNYYTNWYHNRFKYFSKAVRPYANRSRDMVLRLAMLMAITRRHWNWIDEDDVRFGAEVLREVGKKIDNVVLPPSNEAQAAEMMLRMLPASSDEIWKVLGRKYPLRILQAAQSLLVESGQAYKDARVWKRKGK